MSQEEFEEIIQSLKEQCFHMSDEEAIELIDEYIEKYPDLSKFQNREWLIINS